MTDFLKKIPWMNRLSPLGQDSVLIFLIMSFFIVLEYCCSRGMLSVDGYSYLFFVREASENGWNHALEVYPRMEAFPPILMLLMCGAGRCGLDALLIGRIVNILCVLLYGQGILRCCYRLYDSRLYAFCSAAIACSVPNVYFFGCMILRDPLFWAELVWALYFVLKLYGETADWKRELRDWTILALICGLSILTRKEGIAWTLIVSCALLCREWHHGRYRWRAALLAFAVFWGVTSAVVALTVTTGFGTYFGHLTEDFEKR